MQCHWGGDVTPITPLSHFAGGEVVTPITPLSHFALLRLVFGFHCICALTIHLRCMKLLSKSLPLLHKGSKWNRELKFKTEKFLKLTLIVAFKFFKKFKSNNNFRC